MQETSGARPVYCTTGLEIIKVPAPGQLCDGLWCSYCVAGTSVGALPWRNRSGLCLPWQRPDLDNRKWASCDTSASLLVPVQAQFSRMTAKRQLYRRTLAAGGPFLWCHGQVTNKSFQKQLFAQWDAFSPLDHAEEGQRFFPFCKGNTQWARDEKQCTESCRVLYVSWVNKCVTFSSSLKSGALYGI